MLGTADGAALLATHGLATVESHRCADVESAVAVAGKIAQPIALKANFPPPAHVGDIDAVLLGLAGEEAVRAAWRELERRVQAARRPWTGAVVQPLVAPGADVLVGTVRDPDFGPVMAIGLGGRQAGLARTVAFRVSPVTVAEADELIDASESVSHPAGWLPRQSAGRSRGAARAHPAVRPAAARGSGGGRGRPHPVRCMPKGRVERRRPSGRVKTW